MKGKKITEFKPRGRTFTGIVVSAKTHKTVTVEWERRRPIPKYEKYEKRKTKVKAHNPENISAEEGDLVVIKECRPISKTKSFIIIEKKEKNTDYLIDKSLKEEQKNRDTIKKEKPKKDGKTSEEKK